MFASKALCRLAFVLLLTPLAAFADGHGGTALPETIDYVRVTLDDEDRSYFADAHAPVELKEFAPPSGPIGVAGMQPAKSLVFTTADRTWATDWHPTPRRQFFFILAGAITIEVESGEKRHFGAGDIVLLEDVRGRGHDSRVVSDEPAVFAMVAVP